MAEQMTKPFRFFCLLAAAMVSFSVSAPPVFAADLGIDKNSLGFVDNSYVTVRVNMARILRIASPAQTVIIGNPGIADVTIQDPQTLILTGRGYGQTNLIVLDAAGNAIADTIIEVVQVQAELVTVYQGSARTTLSCVPNCQPVVLLGDDTGFTSLAITSSEMVAGSAN